VKKSTILYGFFAVLGVVLLILDIEGTYLGNRYFLSVLTLFSSRSYLGYGLGWVGIVLVTVGMFGIMRQYFKNLTQPFTVFLFLSILLLTYFIFGIFYASIVLNPNNYPPSMLIALA